MIVPRWRLICGGHYNGVRVGRVVRAVWGSVHVQL